MSRLVQYLYDGDYSPLPYSTSTLHFTAIGHVEMLTMAGHMEMCGLQELATEKFEHACEEVCSEGEAVARVAEFLYLHCKQELYTHPVANKLRKVFEKVAKKHIVDLLTDARYE